jgi:4-amino-4-deoxy-L-arabinose transferase-like glycosyltransferase
MGLTVPTAWAIRFAGRQEWPLLIYPFVASLAGVVVAYAAGQTSFGLRGAVATALIYATIPLILMQATKLGPEIPACVCANLGMLLTYLATRQAGAWKGLSVACLAGLSFGAAWMH